MRPLLILSLLALTACPNGNSSDSSSGGNALAIPLDDPSASPTPDPSPTPSISCAPLNGTHWVIDGDPLLQATSQDQTGHAPYISEFIPQGNDFSFTENQFVAGFGTLTCTRLLSTGSPVSDPLSLFWPQVIGDCGAVSTWVILDDSQCNQLNVTIMYGTPTTLNGVYETAIYIPN